MKSETVAALDVKPFKKTPAFDSFYSLPDGLRWNGTIVAFRIPYNVDKFNYINYIE